MAAAFWEVLGHGEVILRNAVHRELTAHHQLRGDPGEWFDDPQGGVPLAGRGGRTDGETAGRAGGAAGQGRR